jgi:hypothetical protein
MSGREILRAARVLAAVTALLPLGAVGLAAPPVHGSVFATPEEAATPDYLARTARNRTAFLDFVRLYYGERKVREAFDRYVAADYQQHNPHIADGREAAVAWLLKMTTGSTVRMEIRRITVDGDYAVVHLHASQGPDDPGHVIMNLFRLQDGIIREHWDVTQPVPATTASGRPLG